jgi:hypothetical protein
MESDHVIDRLHAVEQDVHSLATDVAVLRSEHNTTALTLAGMATDLRAIRDLNQQQVGAMKFVRIGWAVIGGVIAMLSAVVAYFARMQ